ncbi:type II secretion system F family protein [Dechloromonas sp. ARDL1]|uniref:type II secretion system F family protein n=1 Tax=Dechloromonas sp. ARDL1 TaxID=3322121 RepID=UPI003DA78B38
MKLYKYVAIDESGRRQTGRKEGESAMAVATALRTESGLKVRSVDEDVSSSIKGKPTKKEIEHFFYSLGDMMDAGIAIQEALSTIQTSLSGTPVSALAGEIRDDLESGLELYQTLARHPKIFTRLDIGIVRAGEETGNIVTALMRVFEMRRFSREMGEQVSRALLYPKIILGVCLAGLLIVNFFVLPTFAKMYEGLGSELPALTLAFMSMSSFFIDYWYLIIGGLTVSIVAFLKWSATDEGRESLERIVAKMPVMKKLVMKASLARYCHALADGHATGLPIDRTMTLALDATGNAAIEDKLRIIAVKLEEGKDIGTSFASSEIFKLKENAIPLAMITSAATTGRLDVGLKKLAAVYKNETEETVKMLPSLIEPLMIIFIGMLVLIMIIAIGLPIWDLAKVALRGH